jgi:hypothetical protein
LCTNYLSSLAPEEKIKTFKEMYRLAKYYIIISCDFNKEYATEEEYKSWLENPFVNSKMSIMDLIGNFKFQRVIVLELPKDPEYKHINCMWVLKK